MTCLWDIEFLAMIIYGIPGLFFYVLTCFIIILKRKLLFKTHFYTLFIILAVVNISIYLNKFVIGRVALYTEKDGVFAGIFEMKHFWGLEFLHWIHWHIQAVEYTLTLVIAIDRHIALVNGISAYQKWSGKYFVLCIVIAFALPLFYSYGILTGNSWFLYSSTTKNYQIEFTAPHDLMYHGSLGVILLSSFICIVINFKILYWFRKENTHISHGKANMEFKLFMNSFLEAVAACITSVFLVIQFVADFNKEDRTLFNRSRLWLFYSADFQALIPPIILLFTSSTVRNAIKKTVFRRNTPSHSNSVTVF